MTEAEQIERLKAAVDILTDWIDDFGILKSGSEELVCLSGCRAAVEQAHGIIDGTIPLPRESEYPEIETMPQGDTQ